MTEENKEHKEHIHLRILRRDPKLLSILVSRLIPLSYVFPGIKRNFGKTQCPFHKDTDPSAKLYEDKDGTERLYCFACNKQYTSWHYIKNIMGESPYDILIKKYDMSTLDGYAKILINDNLSGKYDSKIYEELQKKSKDVPDFKKIRDIDSFLKAIYF